jgi:long-subunit fatty acid transport protein
MPYLNPNCSYDMRERLSLGLSFQPCAGNHELLIDWVPHFGNMKAPIELVSFELAWTLDLIVCPSVCTF